MYQGKTAEAFANQQPTSLIFVFCAKDLTKGTINKVKSTTGNVMTYSEKTLSLMREANIHEFVELLNFFWEKNMTYEERKEAFTVMVYLGAIIILAYNFISNLMSGMVFAAAWMKMTVATGQSPLAPGMWATFLQTRATLDLLFGGPFVPARAIVTIPWFFFYRRVVVGIAYTSPLREKFPVLNRYFSLIFTWILANLTVVGGVTFGLVRLGSLWSGVPVFPVAVP